MAKKMPKIYIGEPPRQIKWKRLVAVGLVLVGLAGGIGYKLGLGDAEAKYIAYVVLP